MWAAGQSPRQAKEKVCKKAYLYGQILRQTQMILWSVATMHVLLPLSKYKTWMRMNLTGSNEIVHPSNAFINKSARNGSLPDKVSLWKTKAVLDSDKLISLTYEFQNHPFMPQCRNWRRMQSFKLQGRCWWLRLPFCSVWVRKTVNMNVTNCYEVGNFPFFWVNS